MYQADSGEFSSRYRNCVLFQLIPTFHMLSVDELAPELRGLRPVGVWLQCNKGYRAMILD